MTLTAGDPGQYLMGLLVLVRFLLLPSFRVAPEEYALILPIAGSDGRGRAVVGRVGAAST